MGKHKRIQRELVSLGVRAGHFTEPVDKTLYYVKVAESQVGRAERRRIDRLLHSHKFQAMQARLLEADEAKQRKVEQALAAMGLVVTDGDKALIGGDSSIDKVR